MERPATHPTCCKWLESPETTVIAAYLLGKVAVAAGHLLGYPFVYWICIIRGAVSAYSGQGTEAGAHLFEGALFHGSSDGIAL